MASKNNPSAKLPDPKSTLPPPAGAVPVRDADEAAKANSSSSSTPDPDILDMETLGQLLDMDDDDDHSFSRPLVEEYIEQADRTLQEVQDKMADESTSKKDRLEFLSSKGHFLKGSSAALGVIKVRDSCEALQNLGKLKDAAGSTPISEQEAWDKCAEILPTVQEDHKQATAALKALCGL